MTVNKQGVNKQYATHDTYTYKQKNISENTTKGEIPTTHVFK